MPSRGREGDEIVFGWSAFLAPLMSWPVREEQVDRK